MKNSPSDADKDRAEACSYCQAGAMEPGTTTITLERGGLTLVVKEVPGYVCWACGEAELSEETVERLEEMVSGAEAEGMETAVRRYQAFDDPVSVA